MFCMLQLSTTVGLICVQHSLFKNRKKIFKITLKGISPTNSLEEYEENLSNINIFELAYSVNRYSRILKVYNNFI